MRITIKISLLLLLGLLTACGSGSASGIQEETEYESFRDTINGEEFTGFAYVLRSPEDHEANVDEVINTIFENENEVLYMLDMVNRSEEVESQWDEDWNNLDYFNFRNKVAFIDQGSIIDEFDINRDELHASEHNNELAAFIQKYQ